MKKILFFIFLSIFSSTAAQLDREHWFAPMYDGQSNGDGHQYLHLSTNEIIPFYVDVYSNSIVVYQVTLSKGNPAIIPIDRNQIIEDDALQLFTVSTKGLLVKAEKPCFANLRFGAINHAEIITSKGTAGLGTKFYTAVAPNLPYSVNLGFSASFIATEDNTTVTVGNFKKPLIFTNYNGDSSKITFSLNKGEPYIIDGRTAEGDLQKNTAEYQTNLDGFIGAEVISNKPISMTNGNFNGQYATDNKDVGSDILMDQSVPVDKLGKEFIMVKGYGILGNNMEGAVIVASEGNTAVYLNDNVQPSAILANPGDHYLVTEHHYIDRTNNHYNLHIKTDKNVYVYQLLGGVESESFATGGMNYIPPLNCYLPQRIDEISNINKIKNSDSQNFYITKLNIITEKGAEIKVNGVVPDPIYGPFDISANRNLQTWVTYSIPEVRGNITIESNKAVTAGIASGNNAVGYGGYFAGFSSIPLITKIAGECLPSVTLGVTEGFQRYLWLLKVGEKYIPAPGVNNKFTYIPSQAGIYAVQVQQGSCSEVQTPDYKFYNCTKYTNIKYDICSTIDVSPQFALSSQNINNQTIKLDQPPTNGTVTISGGILKYIANPGAFGIETFKYNFCGIGSIPDCESVQATIKLNQIISFSATLEECSFTGTATYDLSLANITADSAVKKKYYLSEDGARNERISEQITNFTSFTSADTKIWVRLSNSFGCISFAPIILKSKAPAKVQPELYTKIHCDDEVDGKIDGIYQVNLESITRVIVENPSQHTISYHRTINDAKNNGPKILGTFGFSPGEKIAVRVVPLNGCPPVTKEITLKTGMPIPLNSPDIITICDDDFDGRKTVNLEDYLRIFTSEASGAKYYLTFGDAQNDRNAIGQNVEIDQHNTFYIRFASTSSCSAIATLEVKIKTPVKSELKTNFEICKEKTKILDAGSGFDKYTWSTGETTQTVEVSVGEYWVDLTTNGCTYRHRVSVKEVDLPIIKSVIIANGTATVEVAGGNSPYFYSINGSKYQSSPVFTNLSSGEYTISVISNDQCSPVQKEISILRILNVITPNGDGKNDILDYSKLQGKELPSLYLFDRFGNTVFTGNTTNQFRWDGKVASRVLPTGSYWYVLQWQEPGSATITKMTGWILLKNRP